MLSEYRVKVLNRIKECEKNGQWDCEVEDNPPSKVLEPNNVDYLNKKLSSKILTRIANRQAVKFYEKMIKNGDFIIKDIKGLENYRLVEGGAFITCNHFSILDNYAIYRAIRDDLGKRRLYKVIKEGNYTSFTGLFGLFFRHCNTLPLSSNLKTMKNFVNSIEVLLNRGEKILIYPEQAMWWNYKKPRPMKKGAFNLASKNNVPIIPSFITMEDSSKLDADGYPVQEFTIWFLPPIYPKKELSDGQNSEYLKEENYRVWKELYEKTYNIPLVYGE